MDVIRDKSFSVIYGKDKKFYLTVYLYHFQEDGRRLLYGFSSVKFDSEKEIFEYILEESTALSNVILIQRLDEE